MTQRSFLKPVPVAGSSTAISSSNGKTMQVFCGSRVLVAGAGKSVLSTLVAEKKLYKAMEDSPPPPAVAFFYYDFRNKETQTVEIALRRIVLQLSAQSPHPYRVLDEHYNLSNGQTLPCFQDLQQILEQLLREIGRTYIILDALDECDVGEFDQLVDLVSALRAWAETPLHLLFTSQPRPVFTEGFEGIPCIPLGFYVTEEDIRFFIGDEIKTKSKYKQWRGQDQIVERIARKSKGMFRLAGCLLLELARCKRTNKLEEVLENLPNDLFEVYERFLKKIDQEDWVYVEATLRYRRKANTTTIFDWLEGLIIEIKGSNETRVQLAHASVQDYLLSNQFHAKFGCDLNEGRSHTFIAQTCISYLLYFGDHPLEEETIPNYPLAVYAANQWCIHLLQCHDRAILFGAAMQLLEDESQQYKALWCLRWDELKLPAGSPLHFRAATRCRGGNSRFSSS
ncbi:hypothetical protein DFH07DRAFT_988126 [Mycena maculata]|uniref:Nephrocystin 3-like N-terminal domain-containing protein n=1 Tax=Mycena maculata TaxID=230809 RepID=A0AAD7JXU1_9AGAR|nr:hypothetical protein DFH07DRAFT_988126 [Mycena maculata]